VYYLYVNTKLNPGDGMTRWAVFLALREAFKLVWHTDRVVSAAVADAWEDVRRVYERNRKLAEVAPDLEALFSKSGKWGPVAVAEVPEPLSRTQPPRDFREPMKGVAR